MNRAGRAFDVYLTCHRRKAAKSQPLSDTVPLFRSILAEAENLQHSFFRTNHISQLALFQKLFLFVLAVYATGTLTNHSHLNFPRFCKTRLWHFLTDTWCYLANMMSILFTDRKREFHVRSHIQADSIIQLIFDRRYFNWNVASEVANREGTHHSDHFGQFQNLLRGIAGLRAITCTLNKGIMDTVEPVFKLAMGLGWRPPCDMTVWEYFTQSFTPRVIEKMILPAARSVLITSDRTSEVHIDNLSIDMDAFRRIIENPTSFHDPYANKTWLDPDFSMRPSG
ncbi:hypothetical protein [Sulfidibacter corallicola]|uniref:Uncharacterized protein n=1 Tax=Sulfidibacter corallicola TaxID=2818388 RepID=A0A8A4TJV4_SULCO|nr:hypothetical protein [Sulfidibacter corallicola]QTD49432.1 hypothetical protein J3U87_27925 [Sulfidibacter corallicola]